MMKKIKTVYRLIIALIIFSACTDDLRDFSYLENIAPPSNVYAAYQITQDNTGLVTITPSADGATFFDIFFGDGTADSAKLKSGENVKNTYGEGTYQVKIIAYNINGDSTEKTQQLIVSFKAPENLVVVIENNAAVSKQVNVNTTADFATMYEFHSGETGVSQPVATANIGEGLSYQYQDAGIYSVKIIAKGGAIATTEYTVDFEVTEILAPITAASTPPARSDADVISIFSDAYTDVTLDELPTSWSSSNFEATTVADDNVWKLTNLDFLGIVTNYANGIDVASMESLHIDYWVPSGTTNELFVKIVNTIDGGEAIESLGTTIAGSWQSIDLDMTGFDGGSLANKNKITQILIDSDGAAGVVYVDNFYFYKASSASTFDDGLLTNGDFESGSDSWIVGVDDNAPAPVVTSSGNTYYSIAVANAGNPWDVNVSQKVEIIDGNTYTLTFDAWSDTNRSIIAGIGLSGGPWSSSTETIDLTTTRTTYTLVLPTGFGAADARVLFDLGAAAGAVNIDNVSLRVGNGNLLTNGDFENGSESWIVGVDDNAPAPVVTSSGNAHYYVSVANAGNPWDVNVSQKVEIIEDNTYTLIFDAWSDTNRSIIAGIGLSEGPWSSTVESVDINTTRTTYTLTLAATGFGAADARVIFDLGANAGSVNIDNVSLSIN
jgi:hypothetical protein